MYKRQLHVLVSLDKRLPLADERAQLVLRKLHAVEAGQAVATLHLIDTQPELAERLLVVLVQVGKRLLEDTTLERIRGILCMVSMMQCLYILRPCERFTIVLPTLRFSKKTGALMSYHSLRVKGSTARFLLPLPLESFLFLPTAAD